MSKDFYVPYAEHPGDMLLRYAEENGITVEEISGLTDIPIETVYDIMLCLTPITLELAEKLEDLTAIPLYKWMCQQSAHDKYMEHLIH